MKDLFIALFVIFTILIAFFIYRLKRRKNVDYTPKYYNHSYSFKDSIIYMKKLASTHIIVSRKKHITWNYKTTKSKWKQLKKNYDKLYMLEGRYDELVPSSKWITDNYYQINEKIKTTKKAFSKHNCQVLPAISDDNYGVYPRIYVVTKEIMSILKNHYSQELMFALIESYQEISPLKISELWAFPVMINLCILEDIASSVVTINQAVKEKIMADKLIDNLIKFNAARDVLFDTILSKTTNINSENELNYSSQIIYRLKERGLVNHPRMSELTKQLPCSENTYSEIMRSESKFQAMIEAEVSNLLLSLKSSNEVKWEEVIEEISVIDSILSREKCGVFKMMTFKTKENYRYEIEELCKNSGRDETFIANKVLSMTQNKKDKQSHVGYYLIGNGKGDLFCQLNLSDKFVQKIRHFFHMNKDRIYLGILYLTILLMSFAAAVFTYIDKRNLGVGILMFFLFLIPSFSLITDLVNKIVLSLVRVKNPPAMNLDEGIPEEYKTTIVVPIILSEKEQLPKYIIKLEQMYLANRSDNLFFSLLSDYHDHHDQEGENDMEIISYGKELLENLNNKYFKDEPPRFFMFHRVRKYNSTDKIYMGWERKRGKLEEFNSYLLGLKETTFFPVFGDIERLKGTKYIITLDSDTKLIRNSANKMIGIMAHPLNKAVIDPKSRKVVEGYGLIQPRISVELKYSSKTLFSRLFASNNGFDPYTTFVSDIYQDVFYEGIFSGKGIYNVETAQKVLSGRIPENSVLSHDLLEGAYLKCAYASDIQLFDSFPANTLSFFKRQHRWIRGDWQLLPWILGRDHLSLLSRWQMLCNLFRSVAPISFMILLLTLLALSYQIYVLWGLLLILLLFHVMLNVNRTLFANITNLGFKFSIKDFLKRVLQNVGRELFFLVILPYRVIISADAIFRTLYRLIFSKKNLLEWQTQEKTDKLIKNSFTGNVKQMRFSLLLTVIIFISSLLLQNNLLSAISAVWLIDPIIAYMTGTEKKKKIKTCSKEKQEFLIEIARSEYKYFERYFREEFNYLIPDNVQFVSDETIAKRTSPTNIGMQLMAFQTARDLGFISFEEYLDKIEKTLETVIRLDKWHGHLYNWYDIQTLKKLHPEYISTVDSGNLTGVLIILKEALKEALHHPVISQTHINGIHMTLDLAGYHKKTEFDNIDQLATLLKELIIQLDNEQNKWFDPNYRIYAKMNLTGFVNDIQNFEKTDVTLYQMINENRSIAKLMNEKINKEISLLDQLIKNCQFSKLFDPKKNLLYIGYNGSTNSYDSSHYDFIASESRLTSYIAVAKGDITAKHWYYLGRPLTLINGNPTFLSWGGTMFEYFMPDLFLKVFNGTVFDITLKNTVKEQLTFARRNRIPYGISESAYFRYDKDLNYQYRAFGVPTLGLRPDLFKFLVVSPYSTFISMRYNEKNYYENLQLLMKFNMRGELGFYDALDFMFSEGKKYKKNNIIKTYMCHHKGMSLMAIDNYLNNNTIVSRFHREAQMKSAEILLEEVKQLGVIVKDVSKKSEKSILKESSQDQPIPRVISKGKYRYPALHVLSNDHFQCVLSSTGSGFSKFDDIMINNWSSDPSNDVYGTFIYVKDMETGKFFSITYSPTFSKPEFYEVIFSIEKVEYKRIENDIDCKMEVSVSPDLNAEIRRITVTNLNSRKPLRLEITSYTEMIIDKLSDFQSHPAFRRLFVETEFDKNARAVIAERRAMDITKKSILFGSTCLLESDPNKLFLHETDRLVFIGRGRTLKNPVGVQSPLNQFGGTGEVVDPCMSLKISMEISPNQNQTVSFISAASYDKQELLETMKSLRNTYAVRDVFHKALFDSKVEMKYLNLNYEKINRIQDLVSSIFYSAKEQYNDGKIINKLSLQNLWKFGISGDYPVVLVKINDFSEIETVKDAMTVLEYLRKNQVNFDLVILNERSEGYQNDLSNSLNDIIQNAKMFASSVKTSNIYMINKDHINDDEAILLDTVAKVILTGKDRLLGDYYTYNLLLNIESKEEKIPEEKDVIYEDGKLDPLDLDMVNGIGGFNKHTKEYVIELKNWQMTPMPWSNVIANRKFGCICTEAGMGYSYNINSRENKISNWSNDPIVNPLPEVVYIKDSYTNKVFTPTATPIRDNSHLRIIHGFGYTVYQHSSNGVLQEMKVFVPKSKRFKYVCIKLKNTTEESRNLNVYYYSDMVLGTDREKTAQFIQTEFDESGRFTYASNPYSNDFNDQITYLYSELPVKSFTCDKNTFFDGGGNYEVPKAIRREKLERRKGCFLNPCMVLQNEVNLEAYEEKEFIYILGQENSIKKITDTCRVYGCAERSHKQFEMIEDFWRDRLETIIINTPDNKMNYLLNGWLLYQAISCRIFARTAFYQVSGAYGFRDQLQDCLSFVNQDERLSKDIILNAASHQFREGDVMHWWHEHNNMGIRTLISDDRLWLPYVVHDYIKSTGDNDILETMVPYLEFGLLADGEAEKFGFPKKSGVQESLYRHCKKAIMRSLILGEHNLPLIGSGDWNDGMNMVGVKNKGESVWLAFFLYDVINKFIEIAENKQDHEFVDMLNSFIIKLKEGIDQSTWDGNWFLRAYFDDGSKLGSKDNIECKIDSISQSWAVISESTDSDKREMAMESLLNYLVDENEKMLLLLFPPFHRTSPNPGYIQGYLRGIRENGGQYTHGAIWAVIALIKQKNNNGAYRIFDFLNPLSHTQDIGGVNKYKLEPYIMAADIYHNQIQMGRGGWSFYTGAAGWMYQAGLYWILGFNKKGNRLYMTPCIPTSWHKFSIEYTYKETKYSINIEKSIKKGEKEKICFLDNTKIEEDYITLINDRGTHNVLMIISS
ncbi:MAG: hypothetical protein JXQ23_11595 [Clostridia bacterium]|nr:hypothetical protein [Clostridia bacterium]